MTTTASSTSTGATRMGASDQRQTDQNALLLMLAYVEAECLRLGATGAARHAALAAALLGGGAEESLPPAPLGQH